LHYLIQMMREHTKKWGPLHGYLIGEPLPYRKDGQEVAHSSSKYLSFHLRFEVDMAAYSMCEFGGGEDERRELQAYTEIHFPTVTIHKKSVKIPSAAALGALGRCPLTLEETVLMLVGPGFKRGTQIYREVFMS